MMRSSVVSLSLTSALACALLLGTGCASRPVVAAEKAAASVLISPEQENKLGGELHQQLEKEGMKLLTDTEVTRYIDELIRPILQQAKKDRPEMRWRVYVVDDPAVNAFATPGGFIYVQKGLILAAKTESELAGVLAHEAGHVTGRHGARNLVQQYGLQTVLGLALGENPGQLAQLGAQVLATGAMLKHSRGQEIEADEYGARYASGAGYDPRGLIAFFQTLQKESGDMPRALTWLSTHPAHADRIDHLQRFIREKKLRAGTANPVGKLPQIQQRLRGGAAAAN